MEDRESGASDTNVVDHVLKKILFHGSDPSATRSDPLELEELRELGWLKIEGEQLDPLHAALLARWIAAEHLVDLAARQPRMNDDEIFGLKSAFLIQTSFCVDELVGTKEDPTPTRSYGEVAEIIQRQRDNYWAGFKVGQGPGRRRTRPPDPRAFSGIHSLVSRLTTVRKKFREWRFPGDSEEMRQAIRQMLDIQSTDTGDETLRQTLEEVGITPEMLSIPEVVEFLQKRLTEEPTEAAVRIAHRVALAECHFSRA